MSAGSVIDDHGDPCAGRSTESGRSTTAIGWTSSSSTSSCPTATASITTSSARPTTPPARSSTTPIGACSSCGATGSSPTSGAGRCRPGGSSSARRRSTPPPGRSRRDGLAARTAATLAAWNVAGGITDHHFDAFLADGATYIGDPVDAFEAERIAWLTVDEVKDVIRAGEMGDGPGLTAFTYALAFGLLG